MNKSILLALAGVVVIGGVVGFLVMNQGDEKGSDNETAGLTQNAANDNNANQVIIDEERLEGELVSSFPESEIPLYPGNIDNSLGQMNVAGDKPEWNVAVSTDDSFEQVDAAIRQAYESNGWTISSDSKGLTGGTMLITRNDKYMVTITYDDSGANGTSINYGVSQI